MLTAAPGQEASDFAAVIAALLYLGCGALDQAHNLVTPLSWGSATSYAGPPVANSPAASQAAYVHAMLHRQEGPLDGESGTGFSNANYWYRAAGEQPALFPALLQAASAAAAGSPRLEAWVAQHGGRWDPGRFVWLCSQAVESKDALLDGYCQAVAKAEWRLLLSACYAQLQRQPAAGASHKHR